MNRASFVPNQQITDLPVMLPNVTWLECASISPRGKSCCFPHGGRHVRIVDLRYV